MVVFAVLLHDWPSLCGGFFESDDYALLTATRSFTLPELLVLAHNDHSIPLLRLEFYLLESIFGTHPLAYNVWVLVSFSAMIFSGCLLLTECELSKLSIATFIGLCVGWTLWGEFTSGEYILQKYMQITTLGQLTIWSWLRWNRSDRKRYAILSTMFIAAACLMNVSGYWVPCAFIVFVVSDVWTRRGSKAGIAPFISAVAFVVVATALLHRHIYSLPQNDSFLSLANTKPTVSSLMSQNWYYMTTLATSLLVPTPHHFGKVGLLGPIFGGVTCLILFAIIRTFFWLDESKRYLFLSTFLTLCGISAMISLGRPVSGSSYTVAAKYLGPGYVFLCLCCAFCFHGLTSGKRKPNDLLSLKWCMLLVLIHWTIHTSVSVLGWYKFPFLERDVTRLSKVRDHLKQRAAILDIQSTVVSPLLNLQSPLTVPDVPGELLCSNYPALRYPWGEAPPLSVLAAVLTDEQDKLLIANTKIRPDHKSGTAGSRQPLRKIISPEIALHLKANTELRRFFLSSYKLDATPALWPAKTEHTIEGDVLDGVVVLPHESATVYRGEHKPEELSFICFSLAPESSRQITLAFDCDYVDSVEEYPIRVPIDGRTFRIDLMSINAFSLSSTIRSISIFNPGSKPLTIEDVTLNDRLFSEL